MLTITAYAQEASEPRPAQDIYYNMSVELAKLQERDKLACYREMAQHIAARQAAEARVKELEAKLDEKMVELKAELEGAKAERDETVKKLNALNMKLCGDETCP